MSSLEPIGSTHPRPVKRPRGAASPATTPIKAGLAGILLLTAILGLEGVLPWPANGHAAPSPTPTDNFGLLNSGNGTFGPGPQEAVGGATASPGASPTYLTVTGGGPPIAPIAGGGAPYNPPTGAPTPTPTPFPTDTPTPVPTDTPTPAPTDTPTPVPTDTPTVAPTDTPTPAPTDTPTPAPTDTPTPAPTPPPPTDSPTPPTA